MTDVMPDQNTLSENETSETRETATPEAAGEQYAPMGARESTATSETRNLPMPVTDSGDVEGAATSDSAPIEQVTEPSWAAVRHRVAHHARRASRAGQTLLQPPDLWASRQAAPVERLRYARHGDYTPPGGIGRTLKLGYTYAVSVPVAAIASAVSWWFERPARAVLTVLTIVAIWLTAIGQVLAGGLAWVMRLIADWIVL